MVSSHRKAQGALPQKSTGCAPTTKSAQKNGRPKAPVGCCVLRVLLGSSLLLTEVVAVGEVGQGANGVVAVQAGDMQAVKLAGHNQTPLASTVTERAGEAIGRAHV